MTDKRPRSFDLLQPEDLAFLTASALRDLTAFKRCNSAHDGLIGGLICIALPGRGPPSC